MEFATIGPGSHVYYTDHVCKVNAATSLNLNHCITNQNGVMKPKKEKFGRSCNYCSIKKDGHALRCACANEKGEWVDSEIDLNQGFLYNWFGYLSCFNTYETQYKRKYPCKGANWQPSPGENDTACSKGCPQPCDHSIQCGYDKAELVGNFTHDGGMGIDGFDLPENSTALVPEHLKRS
ncbi:uncharacterized protein BCR38DRAFT_414813 [Pseudomassariella vexata]|uniref:Cyanovirin-N domain-containing protein n=1 Tax=Pseudomassariella vexata TaxID=1141098 RepID=A0A1Y2D8N7_9PEZI|nr:uncharacterized protein BCR38DRAFT_414813 [Pseudomassariella vexata]ORY55630.1 hypothetical protein BCR38DRAFT_414813 [Pseudomassariella vexata]